LAQVVSSLPVGSVMAIAKRSTESGDKEAPPAKRAKAEEEEEEEEDDDDDEDDDDEEGDEDDEELGSDEDDSEEFDMEDFEDVEDMTEEKLTTFTEAYKKFCEERDTESGEDRVCLVFGTPTDIRPVPQTAEEFKAKTPYVFLDAAGQDFMETFGEKYMMAFAANMPEEEDDEEEPAEDVDVSKGYEAQLKVWTETLAEVKSMDPKERWQAGIALVHQVLEDNPGNLFESGEKGKECSAVVTKLAEMWSELLKLDDKKMGLYDGAREQLKKMLKSLVDRLEDKEFAKGAYAGKFKVAGL